MPPTEAPEAPATPAVTPFAAALEKAFEQSTPEPAKETAKEPEPKKEPEAEKITTPRDLFKKKDAEKAGEPVAEEPKSAVDAIAPPDFKNDSKARAGWDALKKEAKAAEAAARTEAAQRKELEARLAEYEPLKKQLEERDTKLKEYDEIVARARIEEHPDFRREFIDGRSKLITKAQQIIEESGGDAKAVETALNLKGKPRVEALREIAGELDNFQSGRLGRVIDELTDLDERADAKRAKSKESYEELQKQTKQKELETVEQRNRARKTEFEEVSRRLRGELEVLTEVAGNDQWTTRAKSIVQEAREHVEAHPEADIEAEILARSIPAYRDLFLQADKQVEAHEKKIKELEDELKSIHGKSPSLANRGNGSSTTKPVRGFSETFANLTEGA